jgi:hypothetical protein
MAAHDSKRLEFPAMPAIHGPATGAPEEGGGLLRSAELRLVVAVMVAAGSLLLALLAVARERTDLLLLDFREWRPVNEAAHFTFLQDDPPDRRPFRLTLQLDASGFMAAEREIPAEEGERYCFGVLASHEGPLPAEVPQIAVAVNDAVAWSAPLKSSGKGYAVALSGLRPRRGKIKIRLELRSATGSPPVHFEYASLRECEAR